MRGPRKQLTSVSIKQDIITNTIFNPDFKTTKGMISPVRSRREICSLEQTVHGDAGGVRRELIRAVPVRAFGHVASPGAGAGCYMHPVCMTSFILYFNPTGTGTVTSLQGPTRPEAVLV